MYKLNFVSCVAWVPRGTAKSKPNRFKLSPEELKAQIVEANKKLKEIEKNNHEPGEERMVEGDQGIVDKYGLDNYDDDDNDNFGGTLDPDNIALFADNAQDPYLDDEEHFSDDDEEREDFEIKPTDNLLLVGHVEDDYTSLEVKIYNEVDDMYVHHEIYLQSYPICFEWIDLREHNKGNLVAVGDMNDQVGVWDLDTVDSIDPDIKLKGHSDSVLDLAWNRLTRTQLASVSADHTCRLWDLIASKEISKFQPSQNSVSQSIAFHPLEANVVLTGNACGRACLIDCATGSIKKWNVCRDEIEKVVWNPHNAYTFVAGTSKGAVHVFDVRNENAALMNIQAHDKMVSGLEFSPSVPGCLMTTGEKNLKVWNVKESEAQFLKSIDPQVGKILSLAANPDLAMVVAIGGDNNANNCRVIDIAKSKEVASVFGNH